MLPKEHPIRSIFFDFLMQLPQTFPISAKDCEPSETERLKSRRCDGAVDMFSKRGMVS